VQFRFLFPPPIQRPCEFPYTVAGHRRLGVWPQFAEAVFILGARLDGIGSGDLTKAAYGAADFFASGVLEMFFTG
jgi:hypothetical protein